MSENVEPMSINEGTEGPITAQTNTGLGVWANQQQYYAETRGVR